MTAIPKQLVVICPVYNEEKTVPLFFQRIQQIRENIIEKYHFQLLFVDNSSQDSTPALIGQIALQHDWVGYIRMSRNFGYQRSLECGLRSAFADYYCFIDVDCEDPPEMIRDFLAEIEQGYEVVYGERIDREEPVTLKWARKQYYKLTKMAADEQFNLYMAEFSLFSRTVRDALVQDSSSYPFFRASIARVGYRQKAIPYKRHHRVAGETHYNLWSMFVFGLAGILSSSTFLLRFMAYTFPPWFVLINLLFGLGIYWSDSFYFWMATWLAIVYFGLGIASLSIYMARTYKNTLFQPNYFIDRKNSILRPFLRVEI